MKKKMVPTDCSRGRAGKWHMLAFDAGDGPSRSLQFRPML